KSRRRGFLAMWDLHPGVPSGDELTFSERAADKLRNSMGSWVFVFTFIGVMAAWAIANSVFYLAGTNGKHGFDPYPYILLNLFLSMVAGLQGAILLIAAKRSDQIASQLAEHDFQTDSKAFDRIEAVHSRLDEIRSGEAQDAVGTRMRVAGGATVGKVGRSSSVELRRDEPRALDSDVSAARQAGPGNGVDVSSRVDRQDASAVLVGRDEVACVRAERRGRDLDAAFEPGGVRRDRARPAGAIQSEQRGAVRHRRRDQDPM